MGIRVHRVCAALGAVLCAASSASCAQRYIGIYAIGSARDPSSTPNGGELTVRLAAALDRTIQVLDNDRTSYTAYLVPHGNSAEFTVVVSCHYQAKECSVTLHKRSPGDSETARRYRAVIEQVLDSMDVRWKFGLKTWTFAF